MSTLSLEHEKAFGPACHVIGIDEAGRGPLAGPVFAAAVSLDLDRAAELIQCEWRGINDSKKLSPLRRARLAACILSTPGCRQAVASASACEIDRLNILRATHLAMRRAACALAGAWMPADQIPNPESRRTLAPDATPLRILVDGLAVPTLPFPSQNLIKGDAKSLLIAAASILAKTARDAYCDEMEQKYPGYDFAGHKGYPTPAHLEALNRLGPCPEHRRSFGPVAEACFFHGFPV